MLTALEGMSLSLVTVTVNGLCPWPPLLRFYLWHLLHLLPPLLGAGQIGINL